MTQKSWYKLNRPNEVGNFNIGEHLPIKGCDFTVAHIEEGVVVLALRGFTKRGIAVLEEIKRQQETARSTPAPEEHWEEAFNDGKIEPEQGDLV